MNVLVLQGSPKKSGNTATLTKRILDGMAGAGGDVQISEYWLNDLTIKPCQACFRCAKTFRCFMEDDMQKIYPALEQAQVILFAVPIYWWHMNAQTKLCVDRLTALLSPDDKLPALEGKRIVLVVSYKFRSCAECTIKMFEEFKEWIGIKLDVVEYCAQDGHVSSSPASLRAAYELGKGIAA